MTALTTIEPFKQELALMRPNFLPLLPKTVRPEKFEALVIAAVTSNPKLLECSRESLWRACVQGAELGLSLNPTMGEADILPVWNNRLRCNEAQFRPRYKGLMKLALQSGEVTSIRSVIVHENDEFDVIEGLRRDLIHKPARTNRGAMTNVYCVWTLKGLAEPQFEVMDREQVYKIRGRSSSKNKDGTVIGPWVTDEPEMWRKTVVRRASKYMPISCEAFTKAVAVDNLADSDTEFDITEGGEIVDITASVEEPDYDDTTQVEDLAAEVVDEPAVKLVDIQPTETHKQWLIRAAAAVKALPDARSRQKWGELHEALILEASDVEPKIVARLRQLIDGGE